jgi:hypothetical protein
VSPFCSGGDCVQLQHLDDGRVAIRDSKHPDVQLTFTQAEIAAFLAAALIGAFDDYAGGIDTIYDHYRAQPVGEGR